MIPGFHESGHHAVLVCPFEAGEPYTGGHGPGMVELLAACWRHGVVCRNVHPDHLRVVDGRVRLIDCGSDIRPLESEGEFVAMCRRAWLSYRGAQRPDLGEVMRRARDDPGIPEMDGFEGFHQALRRVTGQHEVPEEVVLGLAGQAERVLDYGCGDGWLASAMADRGLRVLGYDPDPACRPHWKPLRETSDNLGFTHERSEVRAAGRFDLVVCHSPPEPPDSRPSGGRAGEGGGR